VEQYNRLPEVIPTFEQILRKIYKEEDQVIAFIKLASAISSIVIALTYKFLDEGQIWLVSKRRLEGCPQEYHHPSCGGSGFS
jgi:hypothetical protein